MATYKLIQDIEAEDHILGPLSLRQFIFALVAGFLFYICFVMIVKFHAPFLLIVFGPPALFCAFFAFPWGGDQPTEVWALGKLRFWFKPRRRVWSQSGVKEMVTITVPKKIEHIYTNGLSQSEVKSRLQALANTIDSRGWAVKHIDAGEYVPQAVVGGSSERLLNLSASPMEVPNEIPARDMLDPTQNPVAEQFESMIAKSSQDHRQRLIEQLQSTAPELTQPAGGQPAGQWFMSPGGGPAQPVAQDAPSATAPVQYVQAAQATMADEDFLRAQLENQAGADEAYNNLRTLQSTANQSAQSQAAEPMTPPNDPAILSLSNNNDLNVATLAREAHKARNKETQDEVVISLH